MESPKTQQRLLRLNDTIPAVGMVLHVAGRAWDLTEESTYTNDEGYQVTEWTCEAGGTTGYFLREGAADSGVTRWFFTREIDTNAVRVSGERLEEWLKARPGATPPPALSYGGGTYEYGDTTEGIHEEDGKREKKITWDYWDAGRKKNLAVEHWEDHSFECFLGEYVDPDRVVVQPEGATKKRRARESGGVGTNPFVAAVLGMPIGYFFGFIAGCPFDEAFAYALVGGFGLGWLIGVFWVPAPAFAALLAGAGAAATFMQYPPLTTWAGAIVLLGAPILPGWIGKLRGHAGRRRAVQFVGAFAAAAPLTAIGYLHYTSYAPTPNTPTQLTLALAPAGLALVVGILISGLVLGREE
jgi:hypothetical protein